ncbi:glycosyltransferase [Halopseudomonas nanhaiensis]|uniref:glycosyltransferase n=1 Tax=Halopseudomonas nanhaiensis TaxID=2830842 RepID=UPI001CBF7136|nr:glycosyltransferase [Halopseudomonas nanhaiensis]UAW99470.1 glycosyltransferase [Halopseudomonas nanhaiensis]
MGRKRTDLAIVNRSFWPDSQVIGEGLLQFAETAARDHTVCVLTQTSGNLEQTLADAGRGANVQIRACRSYTTSGSGLAKRIAEAIFFMAWTFFSLVRVKPATVYVSTNPPVVVPFVVAVYCRLFRAAYVYHLQDIHPEAANIVVPLNRLVFKVLQALDNFTIRNAAAAVTLSEDMRTYINARASGDIPIHLLDNPSFDRVPAQTGLPEGDVVFCGNAGRLQRIPLVVAAIRAYLKAGGGLRFTFAGGGVHAQDIEALASEYEQVQYKGVISAVEAAELVAGHRWALLPIDDEVTRYAFPSKSSGYALSGAGVLAICGEGTSVARWVRDLNLGVVCEPEHDALIACFSSLEGASAPITVPDELRERLQISHFAQRLTDITLAGGA